MWLKLFTRFSRVKLAFLAGVASGLVISSALMSVSYYDSSFQQRVIRTITQIDFIINRTNTHDTISGKQQHPVLHYGNADLNDGHADELVHHHEFNERIEAERAGPKSFQDQHHHHDDDAVAKDMYTNVRVLCWVMTGQLNHKSRAVHVKATWGKRCNKLIFMSDADDPSLPAVNLNVTAGYDHLTQKTMHAFDYLFANYYDQYDWFIKVDDDTYLVVENLRYFLSAQNFSEAIFFGHKFRRRVDQGYFSGGGGYVISKEALRRFGTRQPKVCARDGDAEDVQFGKCMEKLKVLPGDSEDRANRTRFHCFDPETHLHGHYPKWYHSYDSHKGQYKSMENMSDYAITFHYVDWEKMYTLEYYIYHLRPYGVHSGVQDLNKHHITPS